MPGFVLHLLHGKMCLERGGYPFSEEETARFRIGLLMPDSNKAERIPIPDDRSHFYAPDQQGKILKVPDLDAFPYIGQLDNPFVLGYAAHLYLDRRFFGEYFPRFVRFLDADGQSAQDESRVCQAFLTRSEKRVCVEDFFTEEYLYGDYTMLNRYLVGRYAIEPVREAVVDNPVSEVDMANLPAVLQSLEQYLRDSGDLAEPKVFTRESLEEAVENYADGFCRWVLDVRRGRG